jgi:CheY-like chemotaxis protein
VVYGIILNHLGLLDVESAPGQGSTFRVYFPVGALQPVQTAPVAIRSVADLPRGKESLLIVEDEVSLRSLMLNVLEPCGYKVDMALDGREALLRIENEQLHYDCILLDLNLPELHGLEVFREIKRIRPRTPVLVVSGNITAEIKAKMVALGQNEFLPKPYRLDDLCLQLRSVLDRCAGSV